MCKNVIGFQIFYILLYPFEWSRNKYFLANLSLKTCSVFFFIFSRILPMVFILKLVLFFDACEGMIMTPQTAKFMGLTWGPAGSCRSQMGPMLAPWTLRAGTILQMPRQHCCCCCISKMIRVLEVQKRSLLQAAISLTYIWCTGRICDWIASKEFRPVDSLFVSV